MAKVYACRFKIEYDWFVLSASMIKSKEYSTGVLSARLRKFEDHYSRLESAYENLLNNENDLELLKMYEKQFEKAAICYNQMDAMSAEYNCSQVSHTETDIRTYSRLPVLDLHNFDGDAFEWYSFISMFNSLVLSRKDLTKTEMYHYLFSHMHKEPRMLIQHLPMIDESLDTALEILKSRYENKRMLVDRHISRILNLPTLTNVHSLRTHILNPLLESTRSLKNLGIPVEEWSYILLFIGLTKLPNDIKMRFEHRYGGLNKELPKFDDLIDFLQQECHFIEMNYYSESYDRYSCNKRSTVNKTSPHRTTVGEFRTKPPRIINGCVFCSGTSHSISECFKFNNLSREERRLWVKSKNVCFRCFGNHSAVTCTRNVACYLCGNTGHHKLICTMPVSTPRVETPKPLINSKNNNNFGNGKRHVTVGVIDDQTRCNYYSDITDTQNERTDSHERADSRAVRKPDCELGCVCCVGNSHTSSPHLAHGSECECDACIRS